MNAARSQKFHTLAYGALGLPLAFAALPVYVYVPRFYSERTGLSLAQLGFILLATRICDAAIDPLLGWCVDHVARASMLALALLPFCVGFVVLFNPLNLLSAAFQLCIALLFVYVGFSAASVAHQSAVVDIGRNPQQRTQLSAAREGFGLLGVVLASLLPFVLAADLNNGITYLSWILPPLLLIAAFFTLSTINSAKKNVPVNRVNKATSFMHAARDVMRDPIYRRLLLVFVINGIAAALPATLFLFFVADVLGVERYSGLLLGIYFMSGAMSLPFWVSFAAKQGRIFAWMCSMLLAIAAFAWTARLGRGDLVSFALICLFSGAALGADLAFPTALAADLGERKQRAGIYFGVWNFASKMNLALAAGLALPLLNGLGYVPGNSPSTEDAGRHALIFAYALLPLLFKALAFGLLWRWRKSLEIDV